MREIRLRDGSLWHLETLLADAPAGRSSRRRVSRPRTFVWVRCISGAHEHRLLFASTWDLWPDEVLARALEEDLARAARARPSDVAAAALRPPFDVPAPTPLRAADRE